MQRKLRSLFFLERTLLGDGTQPFNGVFAIRIKGILTDRDLSAALHRLQQKYIQLQMAVGAINTKEPFFFIPDVVAPIPVVFRKCIGVNDWQREALDGLAFRFNIERGTMIKVVCLVADGTTDLILSFHHCICDGGGGVLLIRELLQALDNPFIALGTPKNLLGLEDILPEEFRNSKRVRLKTSFLATLLKAVLSLSTRFISTKNKQLLDRSQDYLLQLKFDAASSSGWIRKCKDAAVTVNTAIGLLLLNAYEILLDKQAKNKISCPVDIRRFASQISDKDLFSFGLVLTLRKRKDYDTTFWGVAALLQKEVDKQINTLQPYEFLMTFEKLHSALAPMLKMLTYGKVGNDLMFSNMGKISLEKEYRHFQLETVFSPVVIGPFANPSTMICSTFNGQLDLSFVSNEQFLPRTKADELFRYIKKVVNSFADYQSSI